jgi:riboflavin synthase
MFTGIIYGLGVVIGIKRLNSQLLIRVQPKFKMNDFQVGESIAVNGCCLTIIKFSNLWFEAYVSAETFLCANLKYLKTKKIVNLERAMKLNDRLGGHIVTGHIDETAKIKKIQAIGASKIVTLTISKINSKYLIERGSITLDGISLTIIGCDKQHCKVNLIPETIRNTIASIWHKGYIVNAEIDTIAKSAAIPINHSCNSIAKDFLFEHGYL